MTASSVEGQRRMDPTIKAQWVSDLRSGNFPQGRGTLHKVRTNYEGNGVDRHEFCCLGVLCESAVAAGVIERQIRPGEEDERNPIMVYHTADHDQAAHWFLPGVVREWSGLDSEDPTVIYDGRKRRVSELNDEGVPFDVIADLIEHQL